MNVDDAPDDDAVRQSYNFAPGYYGLVYRADVPDYGAGPRKQQEDEENHEAVESEVEEDHHHTADDEKHYKLQAMKWGLVPFWTKRNPDYGSLMRTINCRDDSLAQNTGMWTSMKKRKRCIVICQGFYEWLKKNNGKERIPHYIKRKDNQLMMFAGLWDVVQYDGVEEKNYTYTVITTDSNKQLKFLHDRMPVILNPGSDELKTWLDPNRYEWSKDLQSLLKPWDGELEIYPVNKDVGKVGNNSPSFIIPIDSADNKRNIANFFNKPSTKSTKPVVSKVEPKIDIKVESDTQGVNIKSEGPENTDFKPEEKIPDENTETHAPLSIPEDQKTPKTGIKREFGQTDLAKDSPVSPTPSKMAKTTKQTTPRTKSGRKMHSATSNGTVASSKSPEKGAASKKITSFFQKGG